MLNRLSRTTPHTQFNRTFDKLANRTNNSHPSIKRTLIGAGMMCALTAPYLQLTGGTFNKAIGAFFQGGFHPLWIFGLLKKPCRLATAIALTISFPHLADSFIQYMPSFLEQYEYIGINTALLLSCGLETARVIYGKICPKEKLTNSLSAQLQDYTISSQDIADKLVGLSAYRGNFVFAHSIIQSLMKAENMSWKAQAIIKRLDEYAQRPKSKTSKRAKQIIDHLEKKQINLKFPESLDDI